VFEVSWTNAFETISREELGRIQTLRYERMSVSKSKFAVFETFRQTEFVVAARFAFAALCMGLILADSDRLRKSWARFAGFPNATWRPFVTRGDTMSGSTFWPGSKMNEWANEWSKYYTGGKGNYMVAAMEDSGTLQALTFLSRAGRVVGAIPRVR
jgi:purine nucleoside permease